MVSRSGKRNRYQNTGHSADNGYHRAQMPNNYGGHYGGRYSGYGPNYNRYGHSYHNNSHNAYGEDEHIPFYRRNDGYDNYYGSEEEDTPTITSRILAGISGLGKRAHKIIKKRVKKKPAAQSSNVCYEGSQHDDVQQYNKAGIRIQ